MVRVRILLSKGKELIFQVWCRANRDAVVDDTGVHPKSTIREVLFPVLCTGVIQCECTLPRGVILPILPLQLILAHLTQLSNLKLEQTG